MVYEDPERRKLVNAVSRAKEQVKKTEWDLFCYDNHGILHANKLAPGIAAAFGTPDAVLASDSPLEKCAFDGAPLYRISSTIRESDRKIHTLYQCRKCKVMYDLPLNARDKREYKKGMRRMVFGSGLIPQIKRQIFASNPRR